MRILLLMIVTGMFFLSGCVDSIKAPEQIFIATEPAVRVHRTHIIHVRPSPVRRSYQYHHIGSHRRHVSVIRKY